MEKDAPIYVAGHRGLVGSAIQRTLENSGYSNLIVAPRSELDLTESKKVFDFFQATKPRYVYLAAAKVGGIIANSTFPADFIRENLTIQTNIITAAHSASVERLCFLGSSCIYPKYAPQPIKESSLLTDALEPTNRPYAIAKISGIEMCWSYNRQFGTKYISAMPTNLYGPGDNYHPTGSHVIPGLLRRFHEAKQENKDSVTVWGTGAPRREFLFSDDLADALLFLMNLDERVFSSLLDADPLAEMSVPPIVNIGVGEDIAIRDLAELIKSVVDYGGSIDFDTTKPDGTPRKLMDSSRLFDLGWRPKTDLETGLKTAYADFLESEDITERV